MGTLVLALPSVLASVPALELASKLVVALALVLASGLVSRPVEALASVRGSVPQVRAWPPAEGWGLVHQSKGSFHHKGPIRLSQWLRFWDFFLSF